MDKADAYVKGKLGGAGHFRALQKNPGAKPPANPCPSSDYLAYVEWERGFNEGFGQGVRNAQSGRATGDGARQAA